VILNFLKRMKWLRGTPLPKAVKFQNYLINSIYFIFSGKGIGIRAIFCKIEGMTKMVKMISKRVLRVPANKVAIGAKSLED